jgi:hypothetical protein
MKSLEEINELFENSLRLELSELESQRKAVLRVYAIVGILILGAIITFLLIHSETGMFAGIALIVIGIIYGVKNRSKQTIYRQQFKQKVVEKLIKTIDRDWQYDYKAFLSQNEYNEANLFLHHYDRYHGDDMISGKIDKTDFVLSELHTQYKTTTTDSKGNTKTQWYTIFKGLIGHADFNKEINGETYILPDTAEKLFGKWGQKLQSDSRGDLVKLENPEFEKRFAVFSTDQIEARYILTPSIMESLVNFKNTVKNKIHLSIRGSRLYFAISINEDLFEPRVFKSGVNIKDIEKMYSQLNIINLIVKEMNLNTRIWTKD